MRMLHATLGVVLLVLAVITPATAAAAPTEVNVRIEGREETLFEGPILVEPHRVKASSDTRFRTCNGINALDPWNTVPAPVPTSVSADAMRILGLGFDGQWYKQYEDYFITRWGPDGQDEAEYEYWGIVVNNVFTNVGGCQYQLDDGDEVLWIYDAFRGRERISLYPASHAGGALPLTATATVDVPFVVEVDTWASYNEGVPPDSPTRSEDPFEGAEVAPVATAANGFQRVDTDSPETVTTGGDGRASITFHTTGWHRIKATVGEPGAETVIRSNRLDVCVEPAPVCATPPSEDVARTPPPLQAGEGESAPEETEPESQTPPSSTPPSNSPPPSTPVVGRVRVALQALERRRLSEGIVGVSWKVSDAGPGIRRWTISSKRLGDKRARFVNRVSGRTKTAATVRLAKGARYKLRITFVDTLGRGSTAVLGTVRVPR